MLYLKEETKEGKYIVTELTDENVYCMCPICGEEHQIDIYRYLSLPIASFSQNVCCQSCTIALEEDGLDALMEQRKKSLFYELKQQSGE